MKIQAHFLAFMLLTLALSGCATNSCKKNAAETPAPVKTVIPQAIVVPPTPKVAPAAPVASQELVEEKIPVAVMK